MSKQKIILLVINLIIIVVLLSIIAVEKQTGFLSGIDSSLFSVLVIVSVLLALWPLKKRANMRTGLPADDELSLMIKYKTGYYAYYIAMVTWLLIFLLKNKFPGPEVMLGIGIFLSALSVFLTRLFIKQKPNE